MGSSLAGRGWGRCIRNRAFPRIWRYHAFFTTPHNPAREKFHAGGPREEIEASAALSSGRTIVELVAFPQAIHEGRTMVEIIFRNLFTMSRWLWSVFVGAVRGQRDGGVDPRMEYGMTGEIRTPKPGGTALRTPDFEFPKNSIKFDKFPKRFMDRTSMVYYYGSAYCQVIIKYNFNILSKFIELKKFFRTLHFPAFATRSASGHRAPGRTGGRLPGRAPWPASRSRAQARFRTARARCRSKGPRARHPR